MKFTLEEYQIDIKNQSITEGDFSFLDQYDFIYLEQSEYQLSTVYTIKIFRDELLVKSAVIGSHGGRTAINNTSIGLEKDRILICCSDTIFCLTIPDLTLTWKTQADQVACIGVYKIGDTYIIHGEHEISRLDNNGQILWQQSGADIFVTVERKDNFKITENFIEVIDWEYRNYKFDFDGQLANESSFYQTKRQGHLHQFKTIFILIVLFLILCSTCLFQKSIEDKFMEEAFRLEPFRYKKEISELSNFLLMNADTLVNYHQHSDYRKIQLDEGGWNGGYTKVGDCFSIATFREQFIRDYFPAFLIDSFYHYLGQIEPKFISSITICTNNSDYSISKNSGSISFAFNYEKKDISDGTYILYHGLYFNAEFTPNDTLKNEYDMLAKDTLLIDELRYGIWVTPNTW